VLFETLLEFLVFLSEPFELTCAFLELVAQLLEFLPGRPAEQVHRWDVGL